eukprot:TRINITY_DN63711_c0_g1_i1.p1 TRINITY_DN63711_c0_g1~~TRINITY_DN63711_c0_g1_i1.p1  ORF type:complete len:255 (+),score=40.59 TRINITY_DN63711_c0_g1_i1:90-854(+)
MVRLIGLTGPIASGKSAVTDMLTASGIPVVDADKIAHELLSDRSGEVHKRVLAAFGTGVLDEDGVIDRTKVGQIVFSDPAKLRTLNKATHLPILLCIIRQVLSLVMSGHRRIVLDIPLLFKFPLLRRCCLSAVLVVVVDREVQLRRLMARNSLTEDDAKKKISTQAPAEVQRKLADFVLENDGSLEELKRNVNDFVREQPGGWNLLEVAGGGSAAFAVGFSVGAVLAKAAIGAYVNAVGCLGGVIALAGVSKAS